MAQGKANVRRAERETLEARLARLEDTLARLEGTCATCQHATGDGVDVWCERDVSQHGWQVGLVSATFWCIQWQPRPIEET